MRDEQGRFQPGTSGNPQGRPPALGSTIKEHLNIFGQMPEAELRAIADDESALVSKRLAAKAILAALSDPKMALGWTREIMDRTSGKPVQSVEIAADVQQQKVHAVINANIDALAAAFPDLAGPRPLAFCPPEPAELEQEASEDGRG